jgi:hypothetical protein
MESARVKKGGNGQYGYIKNQGEKHKEGEKTTGTAE